VLYPLQAWLLLWHFYKVGGTRIRIRGDEAHGVQPSSVAGLKCSCGAVAVDCGSLMLESPLSEPAV
jgi:hypothetical protein